MGEAMKICVVCGQDCSDRPRVKDAQGRYACKTCQAAADAAARAPKPQIPQNAGPTAGPAVAGGPRPSTLTPPGVRPVPAAAIAPPAPAATSAEPLVPRVTDRQDGRNRVLAIVGGVAAALGVALIIFFQQFNRSVRDQSFDEAPAAMVANEDLEPIALTGLLVWCKSAAVVSWRPGEMANSLLAELDSQAVTRTERLRAAMVAGSLATPEAGLDRLDRLAEELDGGSTLKVDAGWVRALFSGGIEAVPEDARQALRERHGWFGELALAPDAGGAPRRVAVDGMERVIVFQTVNGLVQVAALLVGGIWVLVAFRRLMNGELTGGFDAPAVGGPVYLEAFGIFAAGFVLLLGLSLPAQLAGGTASVVFLGATEILQWTLLAAAFWPLVRGVSRSAWMLDMGLHTGEGVGREIQAGIVGYAVQFPLQLGINFAFHVLGAGLGAEPDTVEQKFPMFEAPVTPNWGLVLLGAAGTVIWAPVFEELIYRGALYQFLRPWVRSAGAILITAVVFGMTHPYDLQGLVTICLMGIVFGLLREWRGSLIAPMVAHFLWNGQIQLQELVILLNLAQ